MTRTKAILLAVAMAMLLIVTGCAKVPQEEINAAKAAVDALAANGIAKFAPEDAKNFNGQMDAAMAEIKAQEGKFFKNYSKAKEQLAALKTGAEAFKGTLAQKKEEAKNAAVTALNDAKTAIEEAKGLLAQAPVGKGSKADIEAMKADLKGIEDSLAGIQTAIDGEDYIVAKDQAAGVKAKAVEISDSVKMAMEKVGKKPKAAAPAAPAAAPKAAPASAAAPKAAPAAAPAPAAPKK